MGCLYHRVETQKLSEIAMTMLLFIFLGISFLCTVTLVGACMISGRSRDDAEETIALEAYDESHAVNPSVPSLQTTTRAAS